MLAVDIEMGGIVFLKDYWRADVDGTEKKGEIYALLESHLVPNISLFGRGNDTRPLRIRLQRQTGGFFPDRRPPLLPVSRAHGNAVIVQSIRI